jgi:hypothetical protein
MKRPITGVVPQPGATLPYSAFSGLKISPNLVRKAIFLKQIELHYKILDHTAIYNTIINIINKILLFIQIC